MNDLRQNEASLRAALDMIGDGFVTIDHEWRYTYLNRAAQEYLTRQRGPLEGRVIWEVFPELVGTELERTYRRAAAGTEVVEFELCGPVRKRWLSIRILPTSGGLAVSFHDVTARKQAEDALRASEARFRALFEHSVDGVFLTAPTGEIFAANPAGCEIFQRTEEELRLGGRALIIDPSDPRLKTLLEERARVGHARGEITFIRKDGTRFIGEVSTSVFVDDAGNPRSSISIRDLTERDRAQAEITRLFERTRELDELKSRFFASVSHDLRTPLTLILAPTQRLIDSPEISAAARRDLEVVARNARTLNRQVDDLLDVAKIEAGRMTLDYAATDLCRLTRFVAGHFEVLAEEKHIAVAIETPEALWAEVDSAKVQRVLLNLLSNAFRFTPAGGRVRIALRPQGDDRAVFRVTDSGPGVPVEQRAAVFERFLQLDGGATRRFGGTGLGLAIAHDLVALHGGEISLDEAPEGGARFVVDLPRSAPVGTAVRPASSEPEVDPARVAEALALEALRGDAPTPAVGPEAADRGLVLVVENNPEMNRFIAETLASEYRVAMAFDGKEGLARAIALKPDLILSDVLMPEMGGEALVREIRQIEALATTPIVLLTAKDDDALRVRLLREGAQDYLTKPFSVEELRARVANLVARKRTEDALRLAEATSLGVVAIAADAVISIDEAQRITKFNDGAEQIFGYTREEAIGAPLDLLLPARFRERHRADVDGFGVGLQSARRMETRPGQLVGRRKNGEEFPADAAISRLQVVGAKVFSVVLRDISAQVRRERDQRFLAEAGSVLSATLDLGDTVANVARLAVDELADVCLIDLLEQPGHPRAWKVVARDPSLTAACDLLSSQSLHRDRPDPIAAALATRQPVLLEAPPLVEYFQGDAAAEALGALQMRSIMAVPLLSGGTACGVIVLVSCDPARVYAAADLLRAQAFAERAALSIENARHYRAAQVALRTREEVLGIVAHDLRNPLNNILFSTRLLRRGTEPGRSSREVIGLIESAVSQMNRIIQDLLDVTIMDAGQLSIDPDPLSPAVVIAASTAAQSLRVASAELELRLEVAPALPEIWADRGRMQQVLDNLIGNAIKFTPPGGLITVGAAPRGGDVLFWVKDNGAGISEEAIAHVFDRFWRARTADRGGAGLGLAIVKGIVETHRGTLWVESTLGEGSTFFFTIPLAPVA